MQLWLCLRLRELAVQCLPQRRPQALAVVEKQRIYAVNATASLLGLEPGMDPAAARSLAGDSPLQLLPRDPEAETQALESLCCWAYGITPHLYPFRGDCLMLEIGGSLKLFGGSDAIIRHARQGLAGRGYSADIALGATPLAAWAFSYAASDDDAEKDYSQSERLHKLPLQTLEPLHEQFVALQRSGFKTLGEVLALPAASLNRRCGAQFRELLQHLSGEVIAPPVHFEPPSCFVDSYPLGYPVRNQDELGPALEQLLASLDDYLRQRQLQTRQLIWHFSGINNYREVLDVRTSQARTPRQDWYRLTRLRLERQPFTEEVELVQLRAEQLESAQPTSGDLFRQASQSESTSQLVDLLSNRLGARAVNSLHHRDAHLPEHSTAETAAGTANALHPADTAQRPFWLLPKPEVLRHEAGELLFWGSRLELIYGPERIEDGWWERSTSRDYFVARNTQGQRFWVFHERREQRWFMQGFFA
ncbi:Y-family DNA polymerase [Congregibacter litoralis]|uniref:Nucleotidyltransferase/DNA polymerase involved in DNA repair n=1 Tax=Congregibacter litoralis KT71 TaxID=314285 RepID=A4AA43_9GAMM|nr:DNA polymerase Y family protein [Congregibacter litoralis]EAQ97360.2 Nucleotidyltransferase/DNA polymerase involved in DNA repair [Congregibacter litoralis KT71]